MSHALSSAEHARHAAFALDVLGPMGPGHHELAARHFARERRSGASPAEHAREVCRPRQQAGALRPEPCDLPCESPIEEVFAHAGAHYWSDHTRVYKQVAVATEYGAFRLDFVLEVHGWRIGVECDGAGFHDRERDAYRDAAILGSHSVAEIVRFRGADLYRCINDCLYILSRMNHRLFRRDQLYRLERLASFGARRVDFNRESDVIEFVGPYVDFDDDEREHQREILWRCWSAQKMPTSWQHLYSRMLSNVRHVSIDAVIEVMRARGFQH